MAQAAAGAKGKVHQQVRELPQGALSIFCYLSIATKLYNGLQSLTQEQLKEYSVLKAKNNARREQAEAEKSDNDGEEDDDGDDSSDVSWIFQLKALMIFVALGYISLAFFFNGVN